MIKTLICEFNGEIIAYGTVRTIEEFISVEIPNMYPDLMTPEEFSKWLNEQHNWKIE